MLDTLNTYKENGWLVSQTHPTLPLTIWNYSLQTQFEGKWDEITIKCRGLVTDDETGEIVARPFPKFWNMEEQKHSPTKNFSVFEKLDGSLGISFKYKGENIFASKGSFISDQCLKGIEIMNDNINEHTSQPLNDGYTYMFEIIYPENRIVVDYGKDEKVVMLGAINTKTGEEVHYSELVMAHGNGWEIVKKYDGINDFKLLKETIDNNQEGYVILFENGERMKVKGEEYFRLHKIMTEISTKSVWEYLKNGSSIEILLEKVPDEFFDKIKEYEKELKNEFQKVSEGVLYHFELLFQKEMTRRDFAKEISSFTKPVQGIMWRMFDDRDFSEGVWNMIKPKFRKL